MELRHLRYFVAVAEAGSVSLAARRLNGTQPALSRQIQDLEQDLGLRLFDRIGRKIVLTGDGEELLGRARRLLVDAEAFRERAQALGGGEGGILRIGATPQFIEAALPEVLARYHRARPGVEVRVIEDGAGPLLSRVHQGELHLAIGVLRAEGLESRLLYPLRVLAVMARHHRLARRRNLAVTDLAVAVAKAVRPLGITVRVGLHTGECEVIGDKVGGIAVHIGARVATRAGDGEVLVSSTVRDLVVGSGIEFEDRGVQALKGVPGDWRLFAVRVAA
jgi:DNA-binding transcriptional LysR family regulator